MTKLKGITKWKQVDGERNAYRYNESDISPAEDLISSKNRVRFVT